MGMCLKFSAPMRQAAFVAVVWTACQGSLAQESSAADWKLTWGHYATSTADVGAGGWDVNLRRSSDAGNVWLGDFQGAAGGLRQVRAGWDRTWSVSPLWRIMPSLQWASGGFWGGSLSFEVGERWFMGAGVGRTNLRNYVNLNFDPNDAWMGSLGYRPSEHESIAVQVVRDNRLNPDQQHIHAVYRFAVPGGDRVTLDLLHKSGLVEGERVRRWGVSLAYDWPVYFVRVAWDPKVNFTSANMARLAVGARF